MKREELRAMGLPEEAVDKIMAQNGHDIERQKQAAAAERAKNQELLEQLTQREARLRELEEGAEEAVQMKLSALEERHTAERLALEERLRQTTFDRGLEAELLRAKARDTAAVRAMLRLDQVTQGEDGAFQGLGEQLAALAQEKPWAFEGQVQTLYAPQAGVAAPGQPTFAEAIRAHYQGPER